MAKKIKRKAFKKIFNFIPGEAPGNYKQNVQGDKPVIELHKYNKRFYSLIEVSSLDDLRVELKNENFQFWVDIRGLGDVKVFDFLRDEFSISTLVLEDITKSIERPKIEEYDNFIFVVSRMMYFDINQDVVNEQLNFIQTDRILFTIQAMPSDCLNPIRKRLTIENGLIREHQISVLTYSVLDVVIDNYFAILAKWNNDLDDLEEKTYNTMNKNVMTQVQQIRRLIVGMKRTAWAERDKVNDMIRSESRFIDQEAKHYLKDVYDHCIQTMEMIESLKEIATSVLEMYLSMVSNRMNEIMKFLTIMSSLFIPLTFIAGIYGMNFAHEDARTGKILHWNMPELYSPHGYLYTIIIMAVIVIAQVIYFWRRGWFK